MVVDIGDGVVDILVGDLISSWLREVFEDFVDWHIGEVLNFFGVSCLERTSVLSCDGA